MTKSLRNGHRDPAQLASQTPLRLVRARLASSRADRRRNYRTVFGVLNELAIDAVATGAESISDTVIETWKPAIEKEAAFA